MHALTSEFFNHAKFDPEKDRLVDTSPPPKTACTAMPPPYARYVPHDPNRHYGYARSEKADDPDGGKPKKLPGWI